MSFNILLFLKLLGGWVPLGVDDGAPGTGAKTGATFLTEVGIDGEANLEFPFDRALGAPLGAGTAPKTVLSDAIGHGQALKRVY